MAYANFPAFKRFNATRVLANNSMLALLAGSRLASHTLKLTDGSAMFLPQIFPSVPDIDRFNLVTAKAQNLLSAGDGHLASVTVPYALAIHEDFVMSVIDALKGTGTSIAVPGKRKLGAATMHETLFDSIGMVRPDAHLELFHILREMRNSHIHEGGRANPRLVASLTGVSSKADSIWKRVALQPASDVVLNGDVVFALGHLFVVFAVIKQLARDVNVALLAYWTHAQWADLTVADYVATSTKLRNSSSWRRSLEGFARSEYGPVGLTSTDLEAAARKATVWTSPKW